MTTRARRLLLVAAIALLPRLAVWARLGARPEAAELYDTRTYAAPADSLLRDGTFRRESGALDSERTPGYPLFLLPFRALTHSPRLPGLAQCLLDSASAALTADAAMTLVPHPLAWTAGLLYALDPVAATHAPLLITEPLFVFLTIACAWILLRTRGPGGAAAAGLLLGLSALTRPVSVYLWLPWSLGLLAHWGLRRWVWAAAFAAAAAMPVASWCARNRAVFGAFELSSMSGMNLYYWEGGATLAVVEGGTFAQTRARLEREDAPLAAGANPFEDSRRLRGLFKTILLAHPGTVARLHATAALKMLLGPGTDQIAAAWWPGEPKPEAPATDPHKATGAGTLAHLRRHPSLWLPLALGTFLLGLTYGGAAWGSARLWLSGDRAGAALFALPAAYLLALSSWSFAYYRFRIPMIPLLAVLAAGTLSRGSGSARS